MIKDNFFKVREILSKSEVLILLTGAGFSAENRDTLTQQTIPTFRSKDGLWNNYPILDQFKYNIDDIASPDGLLLHPSLFYGFYLHRLGMYRRMQPHEGIEKLRKSGKRIFHITSNIDGSANYFPDHVAIHGDLNFWQCSDLECAEKHGSFYFNFLPENELTFRLDIEKIPCEHCALPIRPNVLMYKDTSIIDYIFARDLGAVLANIYQASLLHKIVILEIGAGCIEPSIQMLTNDLKSKYKCPVIRIDPDGESLSNWDYHIPYKAEYALKLLF